MIVSSSGRIIAGSKILINETINEFLGTVDSQWANQANWSLGVVPAQNHVAIIKADCVVNTTAVCRVLLNNYTLTNNFQLQVFETIINNGHIVGTDYLHGSLYYYGDTNSLNLGNFNPVNCILYIKDTPINITSFVSEKEIVRVLVLNTDVTLDVNLTGKIIGFGIPSSNITNKTLTLGTNVSKIESTSTTDTDVGITLGSGYQKIILHLARIVEFIGKNIDQYSVFANDSALINTTIKGGKFRSWYGTHLPDSVTVFNTGNCVVDTAGNLNTSQGVFQIESVTVDHTRYSLYEYPRLTLSKIIGTDTLSIFNNKNYLGYIGDDGEMDLMSGEGVFNCNFEHSIVEYYKEGNQFVKAPNDRYNELRLSGSGVKTLKNNTQCEHLYFDGIATLDLNGHTISGYTKYTDNGNIPRTIPSGFISEVNLIAQNGGAKTLTGDLTCDVMNCTARGAGDTYIDYNSFTIIATIFNDMFNRPVHPGGLRDNIQWTNFGGGTVTVAAPIIIRGVLYILTNAILQIIGSVTMEDGSKLNPYSGAGITIYLPLGISSYYDLDLIPFSNQTAYTINLRQDVVVRGTFTKPDYCTLNKNGFTIKDSNGNDLA